jgi:hypothetical protein
VRNMRIKIATFALALGLGGLGGYAISSNKNPQANNGVLAEGTKVVRRTIHAKRPKPKAAPPHALAATRQALASQPVSTGSSGSASSGSSSSSPVNTGSSGSSGGGSSRPPVSTGSSGGSGGGGGGEGGGGEKEGGDD